MRKKRAARVDAARVLPLLELGQELAGADDRTGHEVREERDVDREVEEVHRLDLAPVDVDDVAHRLEREERDADRQRDAEDLGIDVDPDVGERVACRHLEELRVLEVAEQPEVAGDRDDERDPAVAVVSLPVDDGAPRPGSRSSTTTISRTKREFQ